jgi:RNA polymerase sigma factor (sigma-70 family)
MASSPKPPLSDAPPSSGSRIGDEDLRAWMLQYGPALRRYFLRRANAADADDLVQDVFLLLQARGAASEIENVQGYLFRTAANVLARRRQRTTWPWGAQEDVEQVEGLADEISPERILISKQAIDAIMRALEDLPERSAQAFFLYRFEHLSQEAVALRMGISVKAVEALMRRALRHLFDHVGPRP